MKRNTVYVTSFAVLLSVAALGIGAAFDSPRTLMSRADYSAARKSIDAQTRVAFARCRPETGSAREICKVEARAAERIKIVDLQARYFGTAAAADDARAAHARAHFDVAKARCVAQARETARSECLRAARDDRSREMAEAKKLAAT